MAVNINKNNIILPGDVAYKTGPVSDITDFHKGNELVDLKVKAVANERLFNSLHNKDNSQTAASKLKKLYRDTTKGMNKSETMQHIARIPKIVWDFAVRTYGEDELNDNDKLFNKVFEPWLVVDSSRLRK